MAVFGVPVAHEDDALRAVRSAAEMRDALPELGLRGRIGVMTGEVVTGTAERLATGDAVNVASRLESAAPPGEVLLGEATHELVQAVVDVEPVEPLELKGKAKRVPAYRLVRVRPVPERRHDASFVGRERELALLREAWGRVREEQCCELVTVVGEAGVGKSRLVAEALAGVEAAIVRGRCLPYGEGITYWPVVEVLKQLGERPLDEAVAAPIRSLLGESGAATSADEIAWAFRKTVERAAAEQPLVVVFDDIQWGEDTFLDLIEHVALLSSGASMLLLCISRPEIGERRRSWPVTLRLEPLREEAVEQLIGERIPDELRERIARAAGGNPLFIEEMVAMAGEGDGEVVVPPTLHALLATRLDQLDAGQRGVLERGAIEGEVFHRGAVQALATDGSQVTPHLAALVRNQLIRPDRSQLVGDDGFRFRHLLIRDAAYQALPKTTRAELHERFAAWLADHWAELVELDEVLGYHLEQACRYRAELGMARDDELAEAARRRLTAGGRRAQLLANYDGAARMFERAAALVPPLEVDLLLETELVESLYWAGDGAGALLRAESIAQRAATAGDQVGELCGRIQTGMVRISVEPEGAAESLRALVDQALPVFQVAGHELALYTAYHALAQVEFEHARTDSALEAYERAAVHAQHAGLPQEFLEWRASCRFYGATAVPEILGVAGRAGVTARPAPLAPDVPGAGAGDAGPLRRGATHPRRYAGGAGRTRRRNPARRDDGYRVRVLRAPGRRSRRRCRARSRGVQDARGVGRQELPLDSRREAGASALRTRPARGGRRLGDSGCRTRSERGCVHADAVATGERQRCSRAAASTPRPSGSRARRSRSARRPTTSTARATPGQISQRCSSWPAGGKRARPSLNERSSSSSGRAIASPPNGHAQDWGGCLDVDRR